LHAQLYFIYDILSSSQNKVEEFYSLINFLRAKPLNDWQSFKEKIVDPLKKGRTKAPMKRLHVSIRILVKRHYFQIFIFLQAVLKFIMLRRTKDDTINGKKILDLPPKVIEIVHCDFSPAERRFYNSLEARMKNELEKLEMSEDRRSYMHMLTLLLRARQGE
jgi:SNF2 family DNA or RNA helicase